MFQTDSVCVSMLRAFKVRPGLIYFEEAFGLRIAAESILIEIPDYQGIILAIDQSVDGESRTVGQ